MAMNMWVKLNSYYNFDVVLKFYLFLAVLGLCRYMEAFSSCGEWGLLSQLRGAGLSLGASLTVEHRLQGSWASVVMGHWLSCSDVCGIFLGQILNLSVPPALAGRFLTTGPPGKPLLQSLFIFVYNVLSTITLVKQSEIIQVKMVFSSFGQLSIIARKVLKYHYHVQ